MKTGKFRRFCNGGGKTAEGKSMCGIPLMKKDKECPTCGKVLREERKS